MSSSVATFQTVHGIVRAWLGLSMHETDLVTGVMDELALQQKIDLDEASVDQIRKLADEAFQVCEDEHWFKDF